MVEELLAVELGDALEQRDLLARSGGQLDLTFQVLEQLSRPIAAGVETLEALQRFGRARLELERGLETTDRFLGLVELRLVELRDAARGPGALLPALGEGEPASEAAAALVDDLFVARQLVSEIDRLLNALAE